MLLTLALAFDVQHPAGFFYNIFHGKAKIREQFVSRGGFTTLGESAPAELLFEEFGFTVDNVIAKAKALL